MIEARLEALRKLMIERRMDAYIIPTEDFHQSEYVGDYFKTRKYMSGFTGSAGTLIVTLTEAGLWTDGRYFIQAADELKGSEIVLFKMGEEGVPTPKEYLKEKVKEDGCIGFDGRLISGKFGQNLKEILKDKNIKLAYEEDLVGRVWKERPDLSAEKAFLLDVEYAGKTVEEKLNELRDSMCDKDVTVHILTSLDDIAWLFNIRGNDVKHNPVVLAYSLITLEKAYLFVNQSVLTETMKNELIAEGVTLKDYETIYEEVKQIASSEKVLLDSNKVNYTMMSYLPEGICIVDEMNPTTLFKAVKNEVEISHLRNSHIKDGVAVTKFMYWLKNNVGKIEMTEQSASDYLEERRKEQEGFIELSFTTICAYKEHAAMMHYAANEETNTSLKQEGLLLVDSGGQYFDGTTDITRTMALGEVSEEQKSHFTAVVRSMLNLAHAKFLYGCKGMNLDILARGPLWDLNIDYKCGTGHGVGFLLNVHEAPNGFRWKSVPERSDGCVLEEGMVTTDEPGVYIEGSHGIRIENELVCFKGEKNEYGQFMYFEPLTFAPIDLDCILPDEMQPKEKMLLNDYHQKVYEKLSPYLSDEEKEWLKYYTSNI